MNKIHPLFIYFFLKKYIILVLDRTMAKEKSLIIPHLLSAGWTFGRAKSFLKGYRESILESAWAGVEGKGRLWRLSAHQLSLASQGRAEKQHRRGMTYERSRGQASGQSKPEFLLRICHFIVVGTRTTSLSLTSIKWRDNYNNLKYTAVTFIKLLV